MYFTLNHFILLNWFHADLRKQEETGELTLPVLFVLLVLVSVLLYFAVSLMDPGFVLSDDCDLQVSSETKKSVIIYSPFCLSKPVYDSVVCGTQRKIF